MYGGLVVVANTISTKTTISMLGEASLPCILHWNQNHFVVLYKVKKGKKF
ncbi:cysteine peptidase family C39 domain-containing protein, partial [Segatella copri]